MARTATLIKPFYNDDAIYARRKLTQNKMSAVVQK